ncbi:hypothetical protein [Acinetobacter soli]|uniref:hypothetical protein n=1 Tax=Acinetobacter soli TaxID=487316 RepID=UPI000E6A9ACF|nr:hypothetical protein [Acinetobacter soli]
MPLPSADKFNAATVRQVDFKTAQAQLIDHVATLTKDVAASQGGAYSFITIASFNANKASVPANSIVEIATGADAGKYNWDGTTLLISSYDPVAIAEAYTDEQIGVVSANLVPAYDSVLAVAATKKKAVSAKAQKAAIILNNAPILDAITLLTAELTTLKKRMNAVELEAYTTSAKVQAFNYGYIDADYYISSTNGLDTNAGTINAPFASFAPILAMTANSLDSKVVAVERGSVLAPFDLKVLYAKNFLITNYGDESLALPFIDCTAAITETWTETSTSGIWSCTLTHNADTKVYPNFFKDGIPVTKVTSLTTLASAYENSVYAENQTNASFTLYMKSTVNPATLTLRWSKYSTAINIQGTGSTIDGFEATGNAGQDGAFKVSSLSNTGGCKISRCIINWGNRHSVYCGSGAKPSIVEFCKFYGGANDVETGNVAGISANTVVFNTTDHSAATCISRYNLHVGVSRKSVTGSSTIALTGAYGHDGTNGNPMKKFISQGESFKNISSAHALCASKDIMDGATFDNVDQIFSTSAATTATIQNCKGTANVLIYGINLNTTLNWINNEIEILDLGLANGAFVRYSEGSGSINLNLSGGKIDVKAARNATVSTNKVLFRVKNGSFKSSGLSVYPKVAPAFTYFMDIIAGGTFTVSTGSSGNTYPFGTMFRSSGTAHSLPQWKALGYETDYSTHKYGYTELYDDFTRDDVMLDDDIYSSAGVTTSLAIRSGKLATLNGNTQVGLLANLSQSSGIFCKKTTQSTVGASGIALMAADVNNYIMLRETSTAYQLQVMNAGVSSVSSASALVTPTVGDEAILVLKQTTDPNTAAVTYRAFVIVNEYTVLNDLAITIPPALLSEPKAGFVGRGAANPLLSNASWGRLAT